MNHLSERMLRAYLDNTLSNAESGDLEQHLYQCNQCLEAYLRCIESNRSQVPEESIVEMKEFYPQELNLGDAVMAEIKRTTSASVKVEPLLNQLSPDGPHDSDHHHFSSRARQTFLHYAMAAAITLVLLSTGVFEQLFVIVGQATNQDPTSNANPILEEQVPWSTQMMEHVGSWLDNINEELKEGR